VLRGGGWFDNASSSRVASRHYNAPGSGYHNYGFRLVLP
jgi:formylglycine-generating enzyme required for sulfatase activity